MTDPREEIKRLAGIYARAMASWAQHGYSDQSEYLERCRAALHAAIDAIPLGNLTDAALQGVQAPTPSPSGFIPPGRGEYPRPVIGQTMGWLDGQFLQTGNKQLLEASNLIRDLFFDLLHARREIRSGPADNAGSDEPEGNSQ